MNLAVANAKELGQGALPTSGIAGMFNRSNDMLFHGIKL
jgi:hypothetical protein